MVILDNGHGYDTPGKRSPAGLLSPTEEGVAFFEYEFNRDIVARIDRLLKKNEIPSNILVPEAWDVSLPVRVARVNELHKSNKGAFGISIHANAFTGKEQNKASGFEAFTYFGQSESDVIADYICKEAQESLPFRMRFDTSDGDLDKENRFYILKHTSCPFVLTESGFMDHPEDLRYIMSDIGRQEIAEVHVTAIKKYLHC